MGKIGFMLLGGVIAILGLGILILICMLASWISDKRIMHKINKENNLSYQLAEAKVCLEQLVSEITVGELEVEPNVLQQAENFLNEVKKNDRNTGKGRTKT